MGMTAPHYAFTRDGFAFEIRHEEPDLYVGYCNGVRSVSAGRSDIVSRALVRKHCEGLPAGELVELAVERTRRA